MGVLSRYPALTAWVLLFLILFGPFFVYHFEQKTAILEVYSNLEQKPKPMKRFLPSKDNQEYIRILAIEGGGIYGILPAHVAAYLEQKSGKPMSELFDFIMGTSTGALLTVLYTIPNAQGTPKYSAQQVLEICNVDAKDIFYSPWYHRVLTLNGLVGPKYMTTARYKLLHKFLKSLYFDQLTNNVVIPAYEVTTEDPLLFFNWKTITKDNTNFAVADLLMGAVSPPGFFPSVVFGSDQNRYVLADGALFVNNPSLAALLIAMKSYPHKKYLLVTLGTGVVRPTDLKIEPSTEVDWGDLQWSSDIFSALMGGNKKFNNELVANQFPFPVEFHVFTTEVSPVDNRLDNIEKWNLIRLNKEGERIVQTQQTELDALIPRLLHP